MLATNELPPLAPYVGQQISHKYDGGFVFLSYFVSFVGCWTALELLHRRTGVHGYYNWYLLIGAAFTMGSIAIWSMHFIGNRAIVMDVKGLYIEYSPGFTAGSFFLPICGVGIAFYFFSISENVSIIGTFVGGITVGSAICGMHYMGNGGMSNFIPIYSAPYVAGSTIIAIAASTVALGIFFYSKMKWTNSWAKRLFCASLLAAAVSGMHWVATVGTKYRLKTDEHRFNDGLSRQATVGVVISLAIGACLALFVFAILGQRSRRRTSDRAQQVVLASVTFDEEGKIMVTPEGLLPCRKITNAHLGRSFQDVFDVDHSVFCWCFRASRCWRGVADLIPAIRDYLRTNPPAFNDFMAPQVPTEVEYSTLFKQLFLVAAFDLAETFQESVVNLGMLFDDIMSTGTLGKSKLSPSALFRFCLPRSCTNLNSVERGLGQKTKMSFGRGQVLFVVRKVPKVDSNRLKSLQFGFAHVPNIIDVLARSMEITKEEVDIRMASMWSYVNVERIVEPGVHLGCFALRPLVHRGFDILVRKEAKNMLPTVPLQLSKLEQWQLDVLTRMDNWSVAMCRRHLQERFSAENPREQSFARQLFGGLNALRDEIRTPFFEDARLAARPFQVPCRLNVLGSRHATLITFRILADAHELTAVSTGYEFASLKFFICQQHAYKDSPDNQIFARNLHREFAGMVEGRLTEELTTPSRRHSLYSIYSMHRNQKLRASPPHVRKWPASLGKMYSMGKSTQSNNDNSSTDIFTDGGDHSKLVPRPTGQPFGGIQISHDVEVDVRDVEHGGRSTEIPMRSFGHFSEIGLDEEEECFAGKLTSLIARERKRG